MKTVRLVSSFAFVLIALMMLFGGLSFTRSAYGSSATAPANELPAPHLGYGVNVWDQTQLMAGLGFDWIKLFEEAGPPPTVTLPYKVLYRVFVDGYPSSLSAYLQHIYDLAQAGRGKVQAYEIGNETNLRGEGFWGNHDVNPEAYADLLCAVYPVIKSVDPQAIVVSAGLAPVGPWGSQFWNQVMDETVYAQRLLDRMKADNNGQFCIDAFGYHPHGFAYPPETDYHTVSNGFAFRSAERIHDIMVAEGATTMQLWATEFGWIRTPTSDSWIDGTGNLSSYGWCTGQPEMSGFLWMLVTEQQQADYLVRAFQYADANWPWMGPMFVWNLDMYYRGTSCTPQRFYALFHATSGDPAQQSPTLAYAALAALPKRLTAVPQLAVQPAQFVFLSEVATPTVQTRTLRLSNLAANSILTWTITISPADALQPIVGGAPSGALTGTLSGTANITLPVSVDTGSITQTGVFTAYLYITAEPTETIDAPVAVPVAVIAVDQLQRTYLPLIARNYSPPISITQELGLAFVSSAESPANETRYQRAQAIDSNLNRWPMYWPAIETDPINHPRVFDWSKQDANIIADINHGLTDLPILMLTPIGLDTGGSLLVTPPKVGDGLRLRLQDQSRLPNIPSSQSTPPQGLYLSVFTDGSDEPGPGKTINPNNRWAYFVNAAVRRYMPGGVLARQQGWSSDKGIHYWEIWNEEDFSFFFSGTAADFARIQKVAYFAAKFAAPDTTIVFGGLAHFEKPNWFNDVLNVIATDPLSTTYHGFMDAVASHAYSWAWQTFDYLSSDRARLKAHGLSEVKSWLTETGVPVCDDPPYVFCPGTYRASMSEQSDYLIQTVAWADWQFAAKIVWFQLYDDAGNDCKYDAFGLVRNPPTGPCTARDGTPRPAYTTYKVAGQYLTGIQPYWRDRRTITATNWISGNQEILAFKHPATGQRVVAMWTRYYTADKVYLTATSSSALLVKPDGSTQTITPVDGVYTIDLPAATNLGANTVDGKEPDGTSPIGGSPRILIEYDPNVTP